MIEGIIWKVEVNDFSADHAHKGEQEQNIDCCCDWGAHPGRNQHC
jgi:hypothetical protein